MKCSLLYCHLWSARPYSIFPHYLINGSILEKEMFLNTKCFFSRFYVQLLSETFLNIISIQRDIIIHADRSSCKELLFLSDFFKKLKIFPNRFSEKKLKYQI